MGQSTSFVIPDLTNKTFVITGANTGIGFVTAKRIAEKGARVYLACRNESRGLEAKSKIKGSEFLLLDLSSLKSVVRACEYLEKQNIKIDCLINNAGIFGGDFQLSEDGYEMHFATNHLGHFLLTLRILKLFTGMKRIVNVGSRMHFYTYDGGLLSEESLKNRSIYNQWRAYGHSKLCNVLFSNYLRETLPDFKVYCVHPGYVKTEISRNFKDAWYKRLVEKLFAKSVEDGALPVLLVSTQDVEQGYYSELKKATESTHALNKVLQTRLYEMSQRMIQFLN